MHQLALLRKERAGLLAELEAAEAKLSATPELTAVREAQAKLNEKNAELSGAEGALRLLAVETFESGACDKHPVPGITIKLFNKVNYDPAAALAWCKEHAATFVREVLDTRVFDKIALDLPGAPVEKITYSQAYIDGDLSGYLEETA